MPQRALYILLSRPILELLMPVLEILKPLALCRTRFSRFNFFFSSHAISQAKALDGLCSKELSRRKKLEELLEKEKDEVKMVIEQNNGFMRKLQIVQGDNLRLESQITKLQDLEKEHGEKFDTAMELLKSFRQKRDEIRIDHENAIKEVNALKRLIKGKSVESSGSEMLDYSFMEINEATNEFDPSWKLGEGKYGSVYKGNLQNLQVAVKMLPSYGSQNHFEFERKVKDLIIILQFSF